MTLFVPINSYLVQTKFLYMGDFANYWKALDLTLFDLATTSWVFPIT